MTKMSKAKWKTYHALTCGDRHPKYIIKHITNHWKWLMNMNGFNILNKRAENMIWLPPNKKDLWYFYSPEECMSFICLNYNKSLKNWYVVNQEQHDLEIHIGWDREEHGPTIGFINGHHNTGDSLDYIWYTRKLPNETGEEIANHWSLFIEMELMEFSRKKLTDKYLSV